MELAPTLFPEMIPSTMLKLMVTPLLPSTRMVEILLMPWKDLELMDFDQNVVISYNNNFNKSA